MKKVFLLLITLIKICGLEAFEKTNTVDLISFRLQEMDSSGSELFERYISDSYPNIVPNIQKLYKDFSQLQASVVISREILECVIDTFGIDTANFREIVQKLQHFKAFQNDEMKQWIESMTQKLKKEESLRKHAKNGNLSKVQELVDQKEINLDSHYFGRTALMFAVALHSKEGYVRPCESEKLKNYNDIVKLLIEKGANVNFKSRGGTTALLQASNVGNCAAVQILLAANADIKASDSIGDSLGQAVFSATIRNQELFPSYLNTIEVLLQADANPNGKQFKLKEQSLVQIASNDQWLSPANKSQLIQLLKQYGATE